MAVTERKASVTWEGDYRVGSGTVQPASEAFADVVVTFGERIESESKQTSPEELVASAVAASYAMTLSNTLSAQGNQPERLDVTAACLLDRTPDGLAITRMELDVKAIVPRLEEDRFMELAQKAEQKCLVSNALRGNVELALNAELLPAPDREAT